MATKKKFYYIANVIFENNHQSVFALATYDVDEELVNMHFESWARTYVGMKLEILRLSPCGLQDYKKITTKISWL